MNKEEVMNIVLLKRQKFEKSGKSMIRWGYPIENSKNEDGIDEVEQWFPDFEPVECTTPDMVLKQGLTGIVSYRRQYDGSFRPQLKSICDSDGSVIYPRG